MNVDVVSDLFAFIAKNCVGNSCVDCFDKGGQKSMELSTERGRAGNTSSPENSCFNSIISAVFLNQNIGGGFGSTHQTVKTAIDAYTFVDSREVPVIFGKFPSLTLFY